MEAFNFLLPMEKDSCLLLLLLLHLTFWGCNVYRFVHSSFNLQHFLLVIIHQTILPPALNRYPTSIALDHTILSTGQQGLINFLVGGWTNPIEKYACQIASFSQTGMNIKNIWNHHPEHLFRIFVKPPSLSYARNLFQLFLLAIESIKIV